METRDWRLVAGGLWLGILLSGLVVITPAVAQEPTPTPRPTATLIPTRAPVVTPAPTPYFNDSTPDNWLDGIMRAFEAAVDMAQTVKTTVGDSLIGKVNEFGNDFCIAIGVLYGGESFVGGYLTTILVSILMAMIIVNLARMGVWLVKTILEFIKIW